MEVEQEAKPDADLRFEIGGREVHAGPAGVPGGDAFATFVALARVLGTHCGGLHAGQICITGGLSGPHRVVAGERVRARVKGLGEVAVRTADQAMRRGQRPVRPDRGAARAALREVAGGVGDGALSGRGRSRGFRTSRPRSN